MSLSLEELPRAFADSCTYACGTTGRSNPRVSPGLNQQELANLLGACIG